MAMMLTHHGDKAPGPFALLSRHVMAHLARGSGSCWWFSGKNRGPTRATAAWICDVDVGDSWCGRNVIGEILTATPNKNQAYTKVIHITILNSRYILCTRVGTYEHTFNLWKL